MPKSGEAEWTLMARVMRDLGGWWRARVVGSVVIAPYIGPVAGMTPAIYRTPDDS